MFKSKEITYGRPKCQHFDTSSPLNILRSYHRCLSAGCAVDSQVTYIYFNLLYSVGLELTIEQHWNYWGDVEKGMVGAFNLGQVIGDYGYGSAVNRPTTKPPTTTTGPFDFPFPGGPPASNFGAPPPPQLPKLPSVPGLPPKKPSNHPLSFYTPPVKDDRCGIAFRSYGGRPCAPPVFPPPKRNSYCPYKQFYVPRFCRLQGSFDGCCDINLCYLPKSEISKMHSGPSHYYSEWSLFSECSASCGGGIQKRYRKCISDDRSKCTERLEDIKRCNTKKCPEWSNWGSYTPCSITCGQSGIQTRTRKCEPQGSFCVGDNEEVRDCNLDPCSGIDSWETWGLWP